MFTDEVVIKVVSANWCQQCGPYKQRLKDEGVEFTEIDADNPDFQHQIVAWGVRSIPATIIEIDGVMKAKVVGNVSVKALQDVVNEIVKEFGI
jgi:glutaredoxin